MKLGVTINKQYVREDGKCAVRMSVSKNGERAWFTFPFAVTPKQWDDKLRRVRPGGNAIEYNRTIAAYLSRAEVLGLEPITAKELVKRLGLGSHGAEVMTVAMRKAVKEHTERFGMRSQVAFETLIRDLEKHLPDVTLGRLTAANVQHFHRSMKGRDLNHNTISKRLRLFRTGYNAALEDAGMSVTKVFVGEVPRERTTRKRMLSPMELERLIAFRSTNEGTMIAKHAFLLQLLLGGMRIGDLITLKPSAFRLRDGLTELNYDMGKTGEAKWVAVPRQAVELMGLYKGGEYVMPLYCGPKLHDLDYATSKVNGPLKVIAAACDLPKDLSTHYARHTFGDWARKNKVPIKTLQMIFGHKDIKTTMVYMASFDTEDVSDTYSLLSSQMPGSMA